MSLYKQKINPRTGQFNLVPSNNVLTWKEGVASQANLPLAGNDLNDARLVNDTHHLYIWTKDAPIGLLTDWKDEGDIIDLNWAAISGKPSSAVGDIDDAVTKRHTQNTDLYLGTQISKYSRYVDCNRTDEYIPDGSVTKPYKKIQDAIDAVTPGIETYVIFIHPGAYFENITLKEYIHLRGLSANNAGVYIIAGGSGNNITSTDVDGVILSGIFLLNNGSGDIISATSSTTLKNLTLENVFVLHQGTGRGIYANKMNILTRNSHGISTVKQSVYLENEAQYNVTGIISSSTEDAIIAKSSVVFLNYVALTSGAGKKDINADATSYVFWGIVSCNLSKVIYTNRLAISNNFITNGDVQLSGNITDGINASSPANIKDAVDKKHDGTLQLSKNAINGSFTTVDGKTITVVDGQITNIV